MRSVLQLLSPKSRLDLSWVGTLLAAPAPHQRTRSAVVLLAVIAAIGLVDYAAGFWISLQLFYLVPIVLSVAWLGWKAGVASAILSVLVRLVGDAAAGMFEHVSPITVFWNRLAEVTMFWIIVGGLHALISLQRELEERVRQRTALLEQAIAARNELQNQLFEAGNRERHAIGHDLHDGLGQHLTATSIAANLLATRLATAHQPTSADAHAIVRLLQEGIAKTRQVARGLLLSTIEPESLVPELEELADTLGKEDGIGCHFTIRGTLRGVTVAATSHLFYIAQEAARNAIRHAHASQLSIDLSIDDCELVLTISDNGTGLAPSAPASPGMGLRIMRHRSELIGGEFTLEARPGGGTRVRCRLPLPPANDASQAA